MSDAGSITCLIPGVRNRDDVAIEALWRRYVPRVRGVARPAVRALPPGAGDEEDVAQSSFRAFFAAAANGFAPELENRDQLWRYLATIARNKAADRVRRETRGRRGGGQSPESGPLSHFVSSEASPSQIVHGREVLDRLFAELEVSDEAKLRAVAIMRLEGASVQDIASELNCTTRTVQRKLHIIERLWAQQNA
jgi:RNA polymerase sigma factor (sigma-70 family)